MHFKIIFASAAVALMTTGEAKKKRGCPDKRLMKYLTTMSDYSSAYSSVSDMIKSASTEISASGESAKSKISTYLEANPTFTSRMGVMSSIIASVTSQYTLTSVTATPMACMGRGPKPKGKKRTSTSSQSTTETTTDDSTETGSADEEASGDDDDE